jgi:hypothetical protein
MVMVVVRIGGHDGVGTGGHSHIVNNHVHDIAGLTQPHACFDAILSCCGLGPSPPPPTQLDP